MSHFPNLVPIVSFTPAVPFPIFLLVVFLPFTFQCPYSLPTLLIPISFLLSSLSVSRVTVFQFGASYFTLIIYINWHIPDFPLIVNCFSASSFPISLRACAVFSQFGATYFTPVTYTNYQIPNFLLPCFSASPFPIFIVSFLCLRIFAPTIIVRHCLQHLDFSKFLFLFHLPPLLFFFDFLRFWKCIFRFWKINGNLWIFDTFL